MDQKLIDDILKQAVSGSNIPGVVAYAANEQDVIYQGSFGQRSLDDEAPMTTDTVFWIASMTKAVTTVAAMQLVEQGKLTLDDPLLAILPEIETIKVLEDIQNGLPSLREPKSPITLRHLLTHTAGFTYNFFHKETIDYIEAESLPGITECKNDALKTPLASDPGESWVYGISTDWVGKVIEAVSQKSLRDYLKENVLEPLGMYDTDFIISPDARNRLASMHSRGEDNKLSTIPFELPQEPEFYMGGGGLYSTAGDYIKFLQMILNEGIYNGSRILKRETVLEMGKNQIGDLNVPPMKSTLPTVTNDVEFFPGMTKKWGLGFLITTEDAPSGRSAGSLSWAGLANTYYWIDPNKRIAGVILTQIFPFADQNVLNLLDQFEKTIYDQLVNINA